MGLPTSGDRANSKLRFLWVFPLHLLLSTVGVGVAAGFLTFAVSSSVRARWILTEIPYYPVQILLAFAIGFALHRWWHHQSMEWVWVIPFGVLCSFFVIRPFPLSVRFDRFFGWGCRPENRCFDQLGITLPFYSAASYSLGAFLSRFFQRPDNEGVNSPSMTRD
jgi:hypothetical protein